MRHFHTLATRIKILFAFLPVWRGIWNPIERLDGYQKYIASGGEDFFMASIPTPLQGDRAVVLGGYLGESSMRLAHLGYSVTAFEPVPDFAEEILRRSKQEEIDIDVVVAAAIGHSRGVDLLIQGDETTLAYRDSKPGLRVESLDFTEWLTIQAEDIRILEVNIEGAEYDLLNLVIDSGSIRRLDSLYIQFHNVGLQSALEAAEIRLKLEKTHRQVWTFEWVWENWERK